MSNFIPGRYPYTYCADFIRSIGIEADREIAGTGFKSPALSRADASAIKTELAKAIGMDEHEFACKVADAYMEREGIAR